MNFATPLIPARLLRRYKRFLADVILPDGGEAVVHCPNPGSMLGLAEPGTICWLSDHRSTSRKLPFGWELAELAKSAEMADRRFVGINTGHANTIVAEALAAGRIAALADHDEIRREVKVGSRSRLDFQLLRHPAASGKPGESCFVEVKSVTLSREDGLAEFPDARTERGARHLLELAELAAAGHRAVLLFLVQRADCNRVTCAADIDPAYADTLRQVAGQVEIRAYDCAFPLDSAGPLDSRGPGGISLAREVPVAGIISR
jgi:sugar fermentation stimulation protein A